jgi:hypothetical protein
MADGKDVFKSLGIKRRSGGGSTDDSEPTAEDAATTEDAKTTKPKRTSSSSGPRLGIKRRSGKALEEAEEAEASPASEGAEGDSDDAADAEGDETASEATAAAGPPSLGEDDTAVLLSNFFKVRTQIRAQIPPQTFGLHRTHGRYIGDGRKERALRIGWTPGLVIYTVPPYMEGEMPTVDREGNLEDPPLHVQPTFIDGGFVVGEKFNRAGDWYVYVVFRSDEPIEVLPPPSQEKKRSGRGSGRGGGPKKGGGDVRSGLGIRRRS